MYRKTEYRKIKYRKTDVQTYMYIFVQTFIYRHRDTQTYRRTDKQADRQTDTVHRGRHPDSRQRRGKGDILADRKTDIQKEGQLGRQILKYLPVLTVWQLFIQASRQAGGLAGRKAGSKEGRKAGRKTGRQ